MSTWPLSWEHGVATVKTKWDTACSTGQDRAYTRNQKNDQIFKQKAFCKHYKKEELGTEEQKL